MTVAPERAKATLEHGGETIYFCAVKCHDRFVAEPAAWAEAVDPVCGMKVSRLHPAAVIRKDGKPNFFCSEACRDRFTDEQKALEMARPPEPAAEGEVRGELQLDVSGMTCASCAMTIEKALAHVPGVKRAAVNLATERALVLLDKPIPLATLLASVRGAGYNAAVRPVAARPDEERARKHEEHRRQQRLMIIAAALSAPVVALSMFGLGFPGSDWGQLALTTAVVFGAGAQFFVVAARKLRHLSANMDTLIALGSGAAYFFSLYQMVWPGTHGTHAGHGHLYFETAAIIVTLILVGRWLEARAKGRAGEAIRTLLDLRPRTARRVKDGREEDVPVEALVVGDRVIVRPGEKLPADGTVRAGESAVDEAMLSGESVPVWKQPGDAVTGAPLNGRGTLTVEVTAVGAATRLAQIVRLVEEAQGSKAPIQRIADTVAGVFVPVVLAVAAASFAAWLWKTGDVTASLLPAVAVLVIACPCSLGLATPTAIMVGTGRAAERGVLIRDAESLERARAIDVVVLDKTGTVTTGHMSLAMIETLGGASEDEALALAAALESRSEHPIGAAVVAAARARNLTVVEPERFEAVAGDGVRGLVGGVEALAGTARMLAAAGMAEPDAVAEAARERIESAGATAIHVARGGHLVALLGVSDTVRDTSASAVAALVALGIEVYLLTGDNARTAAAVGRAVGIDPARVISGVRPEGKAAEVERLRHAGHVVAMVGDGINDAPALAAADVGMAIGGGSDTAMEVAPVTLVRGDVWGVVEAIALSRATVKIIRQNLMWAFVYNVVSIPIAALGLLAAFGGPMLAAGAMAMSSVSVVTNSLRLRKMPLR